MIIPEKISTGFNSMKKINAFASQFSYITASDQSLINFNKSHKTSCSCWNDVSLDYLSAKDLVTYGNFLNWYQLYKSNKSKVNELVNSLSKADYKLIKEHTAIDFLF